MVLPLLLVGTAVGGGAYLADRLGILDSENACFDRWYSRER